MTTDNFCFYLQNRLIQTRQTGGQQYNDTSPFSFSIPGLTFAIKLGCTGLPESNMHQSVNWVTRKFYIIDWHLEDKPGNQSWKNCSQRNGTRWKKIHHSFSNFYTCSHFSCRKDTICRRTKCLQTFSQTICNPTRSITNIKMFLLN